MRQRSKTAGLCFRQPKTEPAKSQFDELMRLADEELRRNRAAKVPPSNMKQLFVAMLNDRYWKELEHAKRDDRRRHEEHVTQEAGALPSDFFGG